MVLSKNEKIAIGVVGGLLGAAILAVGVTFAYLSLAKGAEDPSVEDSSEADAAGVEDTAAASADTNASSGSSSSGSSVVNTLVTAGQTLNTIGNGLQQVNDGLNTVGNTLTSNVITPISGGLKTIQPVNKPSLPKKPKKPKIRF